MAQINKLLLTKNNCYKTGKKQKVKGFMLHCTGANNPFLSRYIGPDDGIVGYNKYGNHWNQPKPDGRNVLVHGFIGYIKNKESVATYQTLDWDHVGWHSGYGRIGSANTRGFIGVEMCEDGLKDKVYFNECYKQAVELCAYLSKLYNFSINKNTVMDHSEGHLKGIASNHGDVKNWFRHHNKTMDNFRTDVKKLLMDGSVSIPTINKNPGKSYMELGDKGGNVKALQTNLNKLGFKTDIDGSFGPATRKVVIDFQTKYNLEIDGFAGIGTQSKIKELLGKENPVPHAPPVTNSKISVDGHWGPATTRALQKALNTTVDGVISGQYPNSVTRAIPSASFTTRTGSSAIKALQRKLKIKADGYIGTDTVKALQRYLGTYVDGLISKPSNMVKEMQRRLNKGDF